MFEPDDNGQSTVVALPSGREWIAIGGRGEWDHYGEPSLAPTGPDAGEDKPARKPTDDDKSLRKTDEARPARKSSTTAKHRAHRSAAKKPAKAAAKKLTGKGAAKKR
jgi:hypothetical protein